MQQIMAEVSKVSNEEKGPNDVGDAADEHNSISDDHKPNYITSSGAGSPKIERELQDNREEVAQNASSSQMSNFEEDRTLKNSDVCQKESVQEEHNIQNIEGRNILIGSKGYESQEDTSESSLQSSNERPENNYHHNTDLPVAATNDDHQEFFEKEFNEPSSTDDDECSESEDGDIQQYDKTDFDGGIVYQDESEYSFYHDRFQYYEENESESDDELDEYNRPVEIATNNFYEDLRKEDTHDVVRNNDNDESGSENNIGSYDEDQNIEEGNAPENPDHKDGCNEVPQNQPSSKEKVGNSSVSFL